MRYFCNNMHNFIDFKRFIQGGPRETDVFVINSTRRVEGGGETFGEGHSTPYFMPFNLHNAAVDC